MPYNLNTNEGKFLKYNGVWIGVPKPVYTLTLQDDGNGSLTATKLTGYAGDTVILSPTYNRYYRFSGYENTGGEIVDNTFTFGESNATAKACFSGNYFLAWGGFKSEPVGGLTNYFTIPANTTLSNTSSQSARTNFYCSITYNNNLPNDFILSSKYFTVGDAKDFSMGISANFAFQFSQNPKSAFAMTYVNLIKDPPEPTWPYPLWTAGHYSLSSISSEQWTASHTNEYNYTNCTYYISAYTYSTFAKGKYNSNAYASLTDIIPTGEYSAKLWSASGYAP